MIYIGAEEYYFWQGIEAGALGLESQIVLQIRTKISLDCELAYICGFAIGEEMTKREFNHLTKPKIRLKANTIKKKDKNKFKNIINTNIKGNC